MSTHEETTLRAVQTLAQAGRFTEAKALLQKETRKGSTSAFDNALAVVHLQLGELELAEYHADRAASAKNANPKAISTLANILMRRGKHEKAVAAFLRSLALAPDYVPALLGLANTQWALLRLADAEALLRRAAALGPDPVVEGTLAAVLVTAGRADEAAAIAASATARFPDDPTAATAHANTANFAPGVCAAEAIEAQRHYGRLLERKRPLPPRPAIRDPRPDRPLRIGFVSQDLRHHSVSYFFEPLLLHLDRAAFEPICYSASTRSDAVTERLRGLASIFRVIAGESDARAAEIIRSDRIDVLVDLSGHTRDHRLDIFHLRPAPVQITYLGYPSITGLAAIDARLVDAITDPLCPDESREASERLLRIEPPFVCYRPSEHAPVPAPRPPGSPITFGSFNAIAKLTTPLLESWARILEAVPGSRLFLKGQALHDVAVRSDLTARLARAGANPASLELQGQTATTQDHLALYHHVDIALDSFPYNGTTTTCEALWQGVPVVTFTGDRHASRVGASLLWAVGCSELVAADLPAYEQLAVSFASDPIRLARYRATLRDRMRSSSLCDGPRFAGTFAAAVRDLWHAACTKAAPSRSITR